MVNYLWSLIFITFLSINSLSGGIVKRSINWNGDWAFACDFHNNDLDNVQIAGADCGGKCAHTTGCTHFTWTTYNGGTCWMKKGLVSKSDAFSTNDVTMVCGVVVSSNQTGSSR